MHSSSDTVGGEFFYHFAVVSGKNCIVTALLEHIDLYSLLLLKPF